MKKTVYIGLLSLLFTVSSCEDFLDEEPISQLSADQFWKTPDDVKAGLAGMYDGLQTVVSQRYIEWGEGRSDNMTNGAIGISEINFALNGITANMGTANWDILYATISRANLAIKYIPQLQGGATEKTKNNYLAQAYAMRAYCHFVATKVWGDVPLMLEPVTDRNFRPFRTPAVEVLAKSIADLELAATLIDPAGANVFEINIGSIYAILTDAYMWQKDYPKVIETTDKLTRLNRYILAPNAREWNAIFSSPASSKEAIWSMFWAFDQDGSNGTTVSIGSATNTSLFEIDDNLLVEWETKKKDFRRYLTYDTLTAPAQAVIDIYKHYPIGPNNPAIAGNVVLGGEQILPPTNQATVQNNLYRLADILLMRAEALNMIGGAANKTAAVTILNQIKTRAGVPTVTAAMYVTPRDLETAILKERQFELFAEGKRWFDLRRTGRVIEVMDPLLRQRQTQRGLTVTGFGDPGLVLFPISRDALNENPNLTQNTPYSR